MGLGEFEEFVRFSKDVMRAKDFDPNYLVLQFVFDRRCYTRQERLDHILCFLCTSHIRSGEQLYQRFRETGSIGDTSSVLMNTQRRGFRKNRKAEIFFNEAHEISLGEIDEIIGGNPNPKEGWKDLRELFEEIPYAGPYHSFKFCDLLKYTMGLPITSPDIGSKPGDTAGAIPGMMRLTGMSAKECALFTLVQEDLFESAKDQGVPFPGMEEFETALCDYDKFKKGKYYVGSNLDGQMIHLEGMPQEYWDARMMTFQSRYLGEFMGWVGERKELRGQWV